MPNSTLGLLRVSHSLDHDFFSGEVVIAGGERRVNPLAARARPRVSHGHALATLRNARGDLGRQDCPLKGPHGAPMIDKVLVPLDGSPLAEAALPIATTLADRTHATLILLRAAHYRSLLSDVAGDQYRVISQAEDYLQQLTERLAAQGLKVQSGVPFGGSPADWIIEDSEYRHVDLVVMATHAREGPDRWLHGSVAEEVVHRSKVPVMLVRAHDSTESEHVAVAFPTEPPVVLVPLDGSALAESALPFAAELQHAIGARLVLIGVVPQPGQLVAGAGGAITTYAGDEHAQLDADAHAYLTAAAERLRAADGTAEILVRYGEAVSEIGAAAEAYPASAVVMATHGRTGVVRAVTGSVAGGVLHHASVPVVLVRPCSSRT